MTKNNGRASFMSEDLSAEHERLGLAVVEIIKSYARTLDHRAVASKASPDELEKLFDETLPIEGVGASEILERFERDIAPHAMGIPSPRYYGLFNPTPLPLAVWADALASAINQNLAAWRNSPPASIIEARVLRWLCELIGYTNPDSFGTLTSGGSEANLIALKCARDRASALTRDEGLRAGGLDLTVYASEQCHYSLVKSVDILGLGRNSLRKISTDDNFQIRLDELRASLERDVRDGRTPCCITGAAGATSTGVVDPLDQLAHIAREYDCWFHVDAAYGGALAFSDKHKAMLKGIEQADSITIDPHKWMFVPFACGATLVRDGAKVLRDAFDITPEYLSEEREHLSGRDAEYDFFRYGQLGTRRFNALKIWMALKHLGVRGYASIIERQIELTRYLATRIDRLENFQRVGPVHTAVCCFRFIPQEARGHDGATLDRLQMALQQRVERSGAAWFSTTILHGRRALRVNINSFLTEQRHVEDLLELLQREGLNLMNDWPARSR
jgi:glutamate/tyrosine decarboxylase-like PLP-dependent enzyme